MAVPRVLFWHRRDLRLADNLGIHKAVGISPAVTGVYVLDPALINPPEFLPPTAPARLWFLTESLVELQQRWLAIGSRLLILEGDPLEVVPQLAKRIDAESVVWNKDVEPYSRERDRQVARSLQADGRKVLVGWDQLLVAPESLKTSTGNPYRVYGPFFRNWRNKVQANRPATVDAPAGLIDLSSDLIPARDPLTAIRHNHGFQGAEICPCRPGEAAALEQLTNFGNNAMSDYELNRNLPGTDATSHLSAALSAGTLSPRQAWCVAQLARSRICNHQQHMAIGVWEQELGWREFYQQSLFHFPQLADGPYREQWSRFPWKNNADWFSIWKEGQTGVPIVDAAMRQLNQSGWMHNRCRMIVASFLVKDLICDWRWGERAFMEMEVDGDLASNNGGWQWSTSSGMDPKPLRIFNPVTQAAKFDAQGDYIRRWLPELKHVNTKDLLTGEIGALERHGYPQPLVDHKKQQALFRTLYSTIRS
ncbi:FAD-binding domain-containing protein [Synechococcus sp. M16CYN]|uniref:cryptochrome/photolyase family protein n=1 Tax=Synechococcus sp. M16CYN TaxID=3103139 RepID=UPI00324EF8E5